MGPPRVGEVYKMLLPDVQQVVVMSVAMLISKLDGEHKSDDRG